MPTPYYNASRVSTARALVQNSTACPPSLTQSPEHLVRDDVAQPQDRYDLSPHSEPSSDNTGAGMAQSQEDSMYLTPATTPDAAPHEICNEDEMDKMDIVREDVKDGTMTPKILNTHDISDIVMQRTTIALEHPLSPMSPAYTAQSPESFPNPSLETCDAQEEQETQTYLSTPPETREDSMINVADEALSKGLAPIDLTFDRDSTTKPWSFSHRRLIPYAPSSVFQSFSRYSGRQQSDRQTYNVDVTILTVDAEQCTLTGFLLIRGLTPEHDTLQTYFTGEIIGGPPRFANEKQAYTFRTSNPAWGATEKTDLTHWARFPAWRSLSSHAKRDINFAFPVDGGNWWEQENIFMRWKEHFLVPDHKTKSIAGASFEGFYYICLNQIQGRISGIYYHSKSEKYQQLELNHEGKPDVFNRGITPSVEFR